MHSMVRNLGLMAALCVLAACALPRGAPVYSEVVKTSPEKAAEQNVQIVPVTRDSADMIKGWPVTGWQGHYRWLAVQRGGGSNILRPGDMLNLTIWDNAENSLITGRDERSAQVAKVEVEPNGTAFVPYVDQVNVSGLTASEARRLIQEKMTQLAPSAQVQLDLEEGVGNSVDLVAGVKTPGTYPLPNRNFSILSLISRGGGISESIRNPLVRLIRGRHTYEIPASELLKDSKKNAILRGGDQVVITEDPRFFVALGTTEKEEIVNFNKEAISGLEAVSILGGLIDARANPAGLLVLRQYEADHVRADDKGPEREYVIFAMDLTSADGLFGAKNFYIQPGDTVLATESVVKPAQAVIALFGSAFAITNAFE